MPMAVVQQPSMTVSCRQLSFVHSAVWNFAYMPTFYSIGFFGAPNFGDELLCSTLAGFLKETRDPADLFVMTRSAEAKGWSELRPVVFEALAQFYTGEVEAAG